VLTVGLVKKGAEACALMLVHACMCGAAVVGPHLRGSCRSGAAHPPCGLDDGEAGPSAPLHLAARNGRNVVADGLAQRRVSDPSALVCCCQVRADCGSPCKQRGRMHRLLLPAVCDRGRIRDIHMIVAALQALRGVLGNIVGAPQNSGEQPAIAVVREAGLNGLKVRRAVLYVT
jgi:hypothetical protein